MNFFSRHRVELLITTLYFVLGCLWIYLSDTVLLWLFPGDSMSGALTRYQTLKGWLYVLSTSLLLYFLVQAAMRSLQDSRAKMRHLLEASPVIMYTLRLNQGVLRPEWVSENVSRLLGYTSEEALKPDWWLKHLHGDDKAAALERSKQLLHGQAMEQEYRFLDKRGNIRWIRDSSRFVDTIPDNQTGREIIGFWLDITAEHEEDEKQRLYTAAFASTHDGIMLVDEQLGIILVNPAMKAISGYNEADLVGGHPRLLESGEHDSSFFEDIRYRLQTRGYWSGEIRSRNKDGTTIPLWVTATAIKNKERELDKYVLIYKDISELKQKEEELRQLAHYDPLTHLPNRLLLNSRLDHALDQARRDDSQIAVLYIDLDDFKNINDSLGHSVGDQLLIEVADRFRRRVRRADTLARLGGDEFVILMEGIASSNAVATLAIDLLGSLKTPCSLPGSHDIFAQACIGISIFPDNGDNSETLMQMADTAMYGAKRLGHNRFRFYTEEMGWHVSRQLRLVTALRHAIEREEFRLYYQPQLDLRSGCVAGAEGLLRWQCPGDGLMAPGAFISQAEASGLISPIGAWALFEAAAQIRRWLARGLDPINITVNVSVRQFRDQNLPSLVREAIDRNGIPPRCLGLEITETALMEQPEQVEPVLRRLKDIGVMLYLDDFGTGFSSFAYLSRFQLDVMKIDCSFIRRINHSEKDNRLVESLIQIAHHLEMLTIAEGVETTEQRDFLRDHGCDIIQGYLYSHPVPGEALDSILPVRGASV